MKNKKEILVLGASGSVGNQALNILRKRKDYLVKGIAIKENVTNETLTKFLKSYKKLRYFYCENKIKAEYIAEKFRFRKFEIRYLKDDYNLLDFIEEVNSEYVLNALSGSAGILPTLKCLDLKKKIFLANKESLVVAGEIIDEKIEKLNEEFPNETFIYPLDSEHSALFKLLKRVDRSEVEAIYITCSGGPFLNLDLEEFKNIKVEDALKHPNFKMGKKITIDSSTLMNKAFEIVEAYYLFKFDIDKIKVVIDKTSTVHSFIKLKDGTYKLSVGKATMETPLIDALNLYEFNTKHNEFKDTVYTNDLKSYNLTRVDEIKFPLINLGYEIIKIKGIEGLIINSANEVLVEAFLNKEINYIDIKVILDKIDETYKETNINKSLITSSFQLKEEDIVKLITLVKDKTNYFIKLLKENELN